MFPPVLVFVAGSPEPAVSQEQTMGTLGRLVSTVVPPNMWLRYRPGPGEPPPGAWHIPGEMQRSIDIVEHEAAKLHVRVQVIDVNRPGDDEALVRQYISPDDVVPVVVRSDRTRLEGLNEITPANVRRFLAHH